MKFLCWILLIVAVELSVFSLAKTTHDKLDIYKDDNDALGVNNSTIHSKHNSHEHAERRVLKKIGKKVTEEVAEKFGKYAPFGQPPKFKKEGGLIFIDQGGVFATAYDVQKKMPLYSFCKISSQELGLLGTYKKRPSTWKQNPELGIDQGSMAIYNQQSIPKQIQIGHLIPAQIMSFSPKSFDATFFFGNTVPQFQAFNAGPWRVGEDYIRKLSTYVFAGKVGDLYLITGTSEARLQGPGGPAIREILGTFPSSSYQSQVHISIPNSMWAVGCFVVNGEVVGAFGAIGNNVQDKEQIYMSIMSVTEIEKFIRIGAGIGPDDPTIELFPGVPACYAPDKQVYGKIPKSIKYPSGLRK